MATNEQAAAIAREFDYGYDEVRIAINTLDQVYERNESARIVRDWASDRLEALDEAARDVVEEFSESV